jgi:uncharacterized membrane protein
MTEVSAAPPVLPEHIEETVRSIKRLHAEHQVNASPHQRVVAGIAALVGRPAFAVVLSLAIVGWIGANALMAAEGLHAIDRPPFQWLQGAMTLVSLFLVVFIVGAQKHEDELIQRRELLTLELAILSEQKAAKLISLLEEFRRDSPQMRDRIDAEADAMAQPADPQSVLDAIKETRGDA